MGARGHPLGSRALLPSTTWLEIYAVHAHGHAAQIAHGARRREAHRAPDPQGTCRNGARTFSNAATAGFPRARDLGGRYARLDLLAQLGRPGEDVERAACRARTGTADRASGNRGSAARNAATSATPVATGRNSRRSSDVHLAAAAADARACGTSARTPPAGSARPAVDARLSADARRSALTPGAPTSSNGRVVPAPLGDARALEQHRSRIDERRLERRHVRRRHDPRRPGLVVVHRTLPPLHRHDVEVCANAEVLVEEPRQLANRHPVTHRNRIEPDERLEARLQHRPFDRVAADRVRPIAHDHLHAVPAGADQAVRHRVDVGVDAGSDVLQVDDEHVEVAAASRRSAPASRCRGNTPARGGPRPARGPSRSCSPGHRSGSRAGGRRSPPAARPDGPGVGRRCARSRGRPTRDCRRSPTRVPASVGVPSRRSESELDGHRRPIISRPEPRGRRRCQRWCWVSEVVSEAVGQRPTSPPAGRARRGRFQALDLLVPGT